MAGAFLTRDCDPEFLARLEAGTNLPLFTSCCPGWVTWVELHRPDLLAHLSTAKSPQQMHGTMAKRGAFARSLGPDFAAGKAEPFVVSVMPCTAKKDEAARPGMSGDVDHVLTTRELARMIRSRGIAFGALEEEGTFDSPLGESTGAAQIFGASGGVMEAMARTAIHLRGAGDTLPLEWHALRGVRDGVKTCEIPGVGTVAVCNGIAAAERLLETDDWREDFVAIEVMACVGGCLGGGGEPKSLDSDILAKRARAIYGIDTDAQRRRSFENLDVQELYATDLGAPNSPRAHNLLHTQYAPRRSKRALLMRFLDSVDRRDGEGAARLCHPEATWSTASLYGEIRGRREIADFIVHGLPPRSFGTAHVRHRMAVAAGTEDLCVRTPDGQLCRFDLEICTTGDGSAQNTMITRMTRHLL